MLGGTFILLTHNRTSIKSYEDMIPEMEMIASSSPEDFYRLLEHVQMRIHHYNQQNSQRQIE